MKKVSYLIFVLALLLLAVLTAGAGIKEPDTFVMANYGTLRTLDPAVCYDATGSQRIWNIYETLIFFEGSSTEKYVPLLAETVPTLENGGISADGKTYTFNRYFKEDGNPVTVRVVRKDRRETEGVWYNTIVVEPEIKTDGLFGEGGEAEIHLTDDERVASGA